MSRNREDATDAYDLFAFKAVIMGVYIYQGSEHPDHKDRHYAYQVDIVTDKGTFSIHGDHDGGPTFEGLTQRVKLSQPNLQNIPVESVEGMKVRRAFVAADLVAGDYRELELRYLSLSEEERKKVDDGRG